MAISTNQKSAITPLIMLLVPILGLLLYFGTLDDAIINEGKQVTTYNTQVTHDEEWRAVWQASTPSHAPSRFMYRPVLAQLLRMEYQTWQDSPSSYHSINLILYLAVVVLFILLSGTLVAHPGARVAAAFTLALHPMFSQAVENIAAQGVLLSLLGCLGAAYVMQLYRRRVLALSWSVALVTLLAMVAIGSHELGLLLPLWLGAIAAMSHVEAPPARAGRKKRASSPPVEDTARSASPLPRILAFALPLAAVLTLYLYQRYKVLGALAPSPLEGLRSPIAVAPSILIAYFYRLLWPVNPTYYYLLTESQGYLLLPWVSWPLLIALVGLTVLACRRWRLLGLGLVLMLTPLAALAHFVPLTFLISEQPLPFALPGLCLALGAVVSRLTAETWSFPPARLRDKALVALMCVAWVAMAWQVYGRTQQWAKPEALWEAEAAKHPHSAVPRTDLMDHYVRQGSAEAARRAGRDARRMARPAELERIVELEAAMAVDIKDDQRLKDLIGETLNEKRKPGRNHLNRMAIFARQRDFKSEAVDLLRRELTLYPDSFEALYELAKSELENRNIPQAMKLSENAVRHAPNPPMRAKALERYGTILAEAGELNAAVFNLNQALILDKTLYLPYIYLARIFWGHHDYQQAQDMIDACFDNVGPNLTSYRDLVELYTGILESQKQIQKSVDWLQLQMSRFPADIPLQLFGARYLIEAGLYDRAERVYQVLSQSPGVPKADVLVGLGLIALRAYKQPANAAKCWRRVLQIDPLNAEAKAFLDDLEQQGGQSAPGAPPAAPTPTPAAPAQPLPAGSGMSLGSPLSGLAAPAATPTPAPTVAK